MFNSLTGIITAKLPQSVFLQVGGIEWDIMVPETALNALPSVGQEARIFTWMYHREDAMKLFGFASAIERSVFFDLTKVHGVGPKAAIKILSSITAGELVETLNKEDMARLEKISGIGKKTAQKMMLALKGKLSLDDDQVEKGSAIRTKSQSAWEDVIVALANMGYEKRICEEVVLKLVDEFKNDDEFTTKGRAQQEEVLFRRAIIDLV